MLGLGLQSNNPYSYYNVAGKNQNNVDSNIKQSPIYYQDGQRARASLSQYDPQQKRPNIKIHGSVPKYQEPQEQQGLYPNKKIIIIHQKKKEDLNAEEQIKQQVQEQINNTKPRCISQQPIISNNPKIRIINQQQNYKKPASPPQFKIKEHKNDEYQLRIQQKSQKSIRPLSRAGIQKNAILQKQQELASVLQKTGQSIFQTVVKTQVSYCCQHCNQGISENMIMLSCQHCYHEQCFIQFIQCQNNCTSLLCHCKQKINIGSWRLNENLKIFIDQILKNQLQAIRRTYQDKLQDCKRCSFFWMKSQSHLAYCPLCLMPAQLK